MNDARVLTHPTFDRPPVLNVRRRGPTPRGIPMLHRERFERRWAEQKAQQESRVADELRYLAELERNIVRLAVALNTTDEFWTMPLGEVIRCIGRGNPADLGLGVSLPPDKMP